MVKTKAEFLTSSPILEDAIRTIVNHGVPSRELREVVELALWTAYGIGYMDAAIPERKEK